MASASTYTQLDDSGKSGYKTPEQEEQAKKFPRAVYRRGSGKQQGDNGLYTAESRIVKSQEEFDQLGQGWAESPEAAASGTENKASREAQERSGAHPSEGVRNVHAGSGAPSDEADKAAKRGK